MKRLFLNSTVIPAIMLAVFENKAGWKLDKDGNIEMKDGNPVYIKEDGSESTVGSDTIGRLNGEAKANRERAEAAEAALEKFKDIDPELATKALKTVKDIDAKKLIDAGEVDKVREQVKAEFEAQIAEKDKAIGELTGNLDSQILDNAFNQSEFVRDAVNVPIDMFRAKFGNNFKVEKGKVVAYGSDGNPLYSKERTGEPASFDEAINLIVSGRPDADRILKADEHRGSGGGGGGGGQGKKNTISRGDFDKLPDMEKSTVGAQMAKGEVTMTD